MLVKLKQIDFESFIDKAYEMAIVPEYTSYPIYYDGIKTRENYIERSKKSFERENEEILLFFYDNKFCGWIHYFYIIEDNYLQTISMSACNNIEYMLKEFLEYINNIFPKISIYFGFPKENIKAIDFLLNNSFKIEEESWNMVKHIHNIDEKNISESIVRINENNYDMFSNIHSKYDGEIYRDSKHILEDLHNWIVFVFLKEKIPIATIYCKKGNIAEIFGCDFVDDYNKEVHKKLILSTIFLSNIEVYRDIIYFCQGNEKIALDELGFSTVGKYILLSNK